VAGPIISEAEARCLNYARQSVHQAVMRGMDRGALADAFMMEALKLAFGLEDPQAAMLADRWKTQALRLLGADYVTNGEDGPRVVKLLRSQTRDGLLGSTGLTRS
jgi:hypothetical protein